MRIAPISFRSFAIQNLNNQQKSYASNVSFQRAYGYDDEDKGYKLYKSSVPLIKNGSRIYGKTYVKDDGREVTVKVNANGRDVGEASVALSNQFVTVNNYYKGSMKKVGTAAYDSLFSYLRRNHPEIRGVRANCTNDGSYRFHIAYGFTDGYKNDPDGYDCYSMTNYLDYGLR